MPDTKLLLQELALVSKKQKTLLQKRAQQKLFVLPAALEEKIPTGVQTKLNEAFSAAFGLIFEKGTGVIEKTYRKENIKETFHAQAEEVICYQSRRNLRAADKLAGRSEKANELLCGMGGIGMGLLGMGLPDIPVFTGFLLKSLYQTALRFGYSYDSEEEKIFILLVVQTSLGRGELQNRSFSLIESYTKTGSFPQPLLPEQEIKITANLLSCELLYLKILQGMPLVGAVGGIYDTVYLKRINDFARLAYRKRYLQDQLKNL